MSCPPIRLALGIAIFFATALGWLGPCTAMGDEPIELPRPMELEGLHAYAEKIIAAGDVIHFRVSSTLPYELSVCRLGWEVDDPAGDEVLFTFPESPPVAQPIHPRSPATATTTRPRTPCEGMACASPPTICTTAAGR